MDQEPTLFEWAGGLPALTKMTGIFYEIHVPNDPVLEPLFADSLPDHPERVAAWLSEVFGGPKIYTERYGGYSRMISQHTGKELTEEQRSRWVSLLCRSADEAGLPTDPEFRSAFVSYLEWGTRIAVENSQLNAHPPPNMSVPGWDWGTAGPPGTRISALSRKEETPPLTSPGEGEAVGFDRHIKPLFRQQDRQSMRWAFDLWSHDDVATHADGILRRIKDGSMPCDGVWPGERVATFERWIELGKQK